MFKYLWIPDLQNSENNFNVVNEHISNIKRVDPNLSLGMIIYILFLQI